LGCVVKENRATEFTQVKFPNVVESCGGNLEDIASQYAAAFNGSKGGTARLDTFLLKETIDRIDELEDLRRRGGGAAETKETREPAREARERRVTLLADMEGVTETTVPTREPTRERVM